MNDYYEVLQVEKSADEKQIKEAFRRLAFEYHPDRNENNAEAAEKMKQINEAYAVLSHPEKRREYDAMRSQFGSAAYDRFRKSHSQEDIFRGTDIHAIFEEMARSFGLRGFDEIFKEFYGPGFRSFEINRPGFSAKGFFFTGGFGARPGSSTKKISMQGAFEKIGRAILENIGIGVHPRKGEDITEFIRLTPEHAKAGGPYAYDYKKQGKKLVVKIPPGVREGQKIRLAGLGKAGKAGGPAGDLYLEVKIKKPLLTRVKELLGGSDF